MNALDLGASLYVPAIHKDLISISSGEKILHLRSIFFCTEDSIHDEEVDYALENLATTLKYLSTLSEPLEIIEKNNLSENFQTLPTQISRPFPFIRPRNPKVLERILKIPHIDCVRGFILPKFTLENMQEWLNILEKYPNFYFMPTLESIDVFDFEKMYALKNALLASSLSHKILVIRVGGLDLFNLLSIRRDCNFTIYETALAHCLRQLICIFKPVGFNLSSPVFEGLEYEEILEKEVKLDLVNGFCVKSAIHPRQIPIIHKVYAVSSLDYQVAQALLDPAQPAVFRMNSRMCEKATHSNWARNTLYQAKLFGVLNS